MPAARAATTAPPPTRRLLLLTSEPIRSDRTETTPRRYRLARVEGTQAARIERFAHLKRAYD